MDRRAEDKPVAVSGQLQKFVDLVVVEYAAVQVVASAAADTAADGLIADPEMYRFYAFLAQCLRDFVQGRIGAALFVRAAVD